MTFLFFKIKHSSTSSLFRPPKGLRIIETLREEGCLGETRLIGENLRWLQKIHGDVEVFHISERLSLETLVCLHFMIINRNPKSINLREQEDQTDSSCSSPTSNFSLDSIESYPKNIKDRCRHNQIARARHQLTLIYQVISFAPCLGIPSRPSTVFRNLCVVHEASGSFLTTSPR